MTIDDDVLEAAKELAARENKTAGKVLSELARRGIHRHRLRSRQIVVNDFEILPAATRIVTPDLVQKILAETGEA